MLIIKRSFSKGNKKKRYSGSGFFDSLISAVTSNTAKEIATNVAKKALTDLGNKASEKVIDKVFPKTTASKKSELTPESRILLNNILTRGKGLKRI